MENQITLEKKTVTNSVVDAFLKKLFSIPAVRVERRKFLNEILVKHSIKYETIDLAIEKTPHEAGIGKELIDKIANKVIKANVQFSSSASFIAGLPGGWGAALAIPADLLQFYVHTLILAQKLAYLYGYQDMWDGGEEEAKKELLLFMSVMFGVSGSAAALKIISETVGKESMEALLKKHVVDNAIQEFSMQLAKKIGGEGVQEGVTHFIKKNATRVVPMVGGVISGRMTHVSLSKMGERLRSALSSAMPDCITEKKTIKQGNSQVKLSISDYLTQLERLVKLRVEGHISDHEYQILKSKVIEECS